MVYNYRKLYCIIVASKGHRRQGSYNDMIENLDTEVDIYITQLSALLKLMQVHIRYIELSTKLHYVVIVKDWINDFHENINFGNKKSSCVFSFYFFFYVEVISQIEVWMPVTITQSYVI